MLFLFGGFAYAQNRVISGSVTDDKGDPIPFASIKVKNEKQGTSADDKGNFSIKVPQGAVLIINSVSFGENLKHSAKPEHLQDSLEIMFPQGKKLELFARRVRPDWTCLGNEVCNGEDITVSLAKLI